MKETEIIEFKREFVNDLNKEVIAFANTNGGEIFIGIDDDGKVVGLNDIENVELQCVNHISNTIKPDISMFVKYERVIADSKEMLKITVNKGSMSPYYIASKGIRPEGVYVRHGTASVPATETAIVSMIKETTGDSFEETRSLNQNLTFVQAEQEFINAGLPFAAAQKRSLGIIGRDDCYTNLGLLLSDQCEHKIKFAVFAGTEKEVFKDRHEFSGSLFRQLDDLTKMLDKYNKLSSPKIESIKRTDVRDYPVEAIREAILNAFVHRDYGLGGYTLVSVFDDRIEIVSLGGLMRGVEMNDLMLGVSYLRNKRLAEIFYRLRFIEAYGTGISKIKKSYEKIKKQPIFECSSNAFKVTLPNTSVKTNDIKIEQDDREILILDLIRKKGEIGRAEVEKLLNISTPTANRILTNMVQTGKIKRNGSARNIKYSL
ncbi:MAG: putative DNA binding domain-containing protein [Clostridia bacterium]|nr:putative DNA binding domain-containing protein [Clostridia bacterium]